jgi:transposase
LPEGHTYKAAGHERRQVVDIKVSRHIKEYQFEIVEDENGKKYTAQAPEEVNASIQYGDSIKSESVCLNNFQMTPYNRIADYFKDRLGISISQGTFHKFNESAYTLLEPFERAAKVNLRAADLAHADETGVNVCGKNHWVHSASNQDWAPYKIDNRSKDAIDRAGILPHFKGVLVHDNLNTHHMYKHCTHALSNAHHLRELKLAETTRQEQTWAPQMQTFLKELNVEVITAGGALNPAEQTTCFFAMSSQIFARRGSRLNAQR